MNKKMVMALGIAFIPVIVLGFFFPKRALDGSTPTTLTVINTPGAPIIAFVSEYCPHCKDFEEFAAANNIPVEYHDINERQNAELFAELQKRTENLQQAVPTIYIDGKVIQGYKDDQTTGNTIALFYATCAEDDRCLPMDAFLESDALVPVRTVDGICIEDCIVDLDTYVFKLPILGEIDLMLLSMPALSVLLGFLDGFNPCAMWVLVTLLTLLINTHDMRKIWVIGGTFLFISGAIYYLFIAAWLNVFLLIGYNLWVQKIIGLVAIGGGGFYLFEALYKDPTVCNVTNPTGRRKVIQRMQHIIHVSVWPLMILGVAILAISVNMIELVCTAGLPAVFTQILAFNNVSDLARYSYLGLYILMYMIDDVVIFAIAVFTLHATGITTRYAKATLVFGGLLMYALGMLLIFAPELLMW